MRPCVLKCQQTVYKTRSLQRRSVPGPTIYHKLVDRVVIANKKARGKSQPKGKRRNKAPSNRRAQKKTQAPAPKFSLSHCATLYANAIANPFSAEEGVCIPSSTGIVRPSQKARSHGRFIAEVGASVGFAIFAPSLANDKWNVFYTRTNFTGTTADFILGTTPGVDASTLASLPYRSTDFTSGTSFTGGRVQGRIVSYGIRWRYIGTELNKGGRVYCLVHPDHDNLYGTQFSVMGNFKECITLPVSRSWQETCIFSQTAVETNYPAGQYALNNTSASTITQDAMEELQVLYPLSQNQFLSSNYITANSTGLTGLVGGAPVAVFFDGVEGNQFEFEVIQHSEFIGTTTQSMLTKSHSDALGYTTVQQAASTLAIKRGANSALSQAKAFASGLSESVATQSGFTMKKAGGMAGEMAFGYMRARSRAARQFGSGALIRDI